MGYHILLVDDEELALRGIEQGVNWDALQITKIYKAHSAQTAIRMLKAYPIDIMLSDIEMPEQNGIDLIRWVRENRDDVVCSFYTCHADFSYAQEAVRLGVTDYLLKPLPYDELQKVLAKLIFIRKKYVDRKQLEELFQDDETEGNDQSAVALVKRFIADNISSDLQRNDLARLVYMHPDYLSRLFKKQEGVSLSDYIITKKLALAKQLLRNTNLSVKDVGIRVGIPYSSYFIRVFKKREGVTPQQYREQSSDVR